MKYYMPVKIYDEYGAVEKHAGELASFGKKALIVTGRTSAVKCGALADVTEALQQNGTEWCVFPEVEENPSVETVMKAREYGLAENADFVIGIGGGSPMDAAKAIALMMKHRDCGADRLYDASLSSEALPVIAVPTTCGTGSEVTGVSVLTRHDKLTKGSIPQRIFPEIALVDGKYLAAAPETVITATALDALAHMLESALMKAGNDFSRMAVEKGLQVWSRSKPVLEGKREASPADYENLLRASTFAGIAIAQTGTSIPHALSYPVTYDIGLAHGRAVGYFLPGFLREAPEKDRLQLLSLAGFEDLGDFSAFVRGILREVNVPLSTLERGFEMVRSNPSRMKGCIFDLDENGLKRIIWESC